MAVAMSFAPLTPVATSYAPKNIQAEQATQPSAPAFTGALPLPEGGTINNSQPQGADSVLAEDKAKAKVMEGLFKEACRTCKNRMYVDGSDDPGVSFKSPANIDPNIAASVVMGHEQEHVSHEQAKAKAKGGRVVSQSVVLHSAICSECGRSYIAGGTTKTITKYTSSPSQTPKTGENLNQTA